MPFSESIKNQAKRAASFHCVWCGQYDVFLEVHHIIPQHQGGASDFENAIALCPNCHTKLGDNPTLRKAIKEKGNWWYDECRQRSQIPVFNPDMLGDFTDKVVNAVASKNQQFMEDSLKGFKDDLRTFLITPLPYARVDQRDNLQRFGNSIVDSMDANNISPVVSALISTSTVTVGPNNSFDSSVRLDIIDEPDKK